MDFFLEKLNHPSILSKQEILECFEYVGDRKDIIIFKLDGVRERSKYSVIITSANSSFNSIRYDAEELQEAVKKALLEYLKVIKR